MDQNNTKNASEGIAPMGLTALNETVLSNQPESRYECPVCLNWLRDPLITTCGHKFCKSCITSWLQNSGHCPIDNINLSMKVDIFLDNYTKREILEPRMSCPFAAKAIVSVPIQSGIINRGSPHDCWDDEVKKVAGSSWMSVAKWQEVEVFIRMGTIAKGI